MAHATQEEEGRDGTLSWRWYSAATGRIRAHDLAIASPAPYHSLSDLWPVFKAAFFEIKYVKTVQDRATVIIEHRTYRTVLFAYLFPMTLNDP